MTKIPKYWQDAIIHLKQCDKKLGSIIDNYHGEYLISRTDAFHTLARAIVGQQISVKAADSVWKKLHNNFEVITPKHVINLSYEQLKLCGLSAKKIEYLQDLANKMFNGELNINILHDYSDEEIIKELIKLRGIGVWTAEMFMIFYLLRPDILPLADIGLQKAIEKHYANGQKLKKDDYIDIARIWQPYRSVATWFLWRSLDPVLVEY